MRIITWLLASLLALTVAGCAASKTKASKSASADRKTMPNVTGKKLDAAEDAIRSAGGDPDRVKEIGGGKLGILVKSNWTVCGQSPAAGESLPTTPQLMVERTCSTTTPASLEPASSTAASSASGAPAPLTVKTSKDLAALLKVGDNCAPSVASFADKYAGREIEFDGSVAKATPHSDPYDIRMDILIGPGDKGANSTAFGPSFQFKNVGTSDLHLTGAKALKVGDKVHILAEVGDYTSGQCLFRLIPVSTKVR